MALMSAIWRTSSDKPRRTSGSPPVKRTLLTPSSVAAFITEMIILPEYQGQGIGSRILEDLIAKCAAHDIIDIQLFCANGKTGFYEKHGFVKRPEQAPGMQFMRKNG